MDTRSPELYDKVDDNSVYHFHHQSTNYHQNIRTEDNKTQNTRTAAKRKTVEINLNFVNCNLAAAESQYYASASHAIGGQSHSAVSSSMMSRTAVSQESRSVQESSFSGFRQGSKTGTSSISSKFEQDHSATSMIATSMSSSSTAAAARTEE